MYNISSYLWHTNQTFITFIHIPYKQVVKSYYNSYDYEQYTMIYHPKLPGCKKQKAERNISDMSHHTK